MAWQMADKDTPPALGPIEGNAIEDQLAAGKITPYEGSVPAGWQAAWFKEWGDPWTIKRSEYYRDALNDIAYVRVIGDNGSFQTNSWMVLKGAGLGSWEPGMPTPTERDNALMQKPWILGGVAIVAVALLLGITVFTGKKK